MSKLTPPALRKYVSWCFAFTFLMDVLILVWRVLYEDRRYYGFGPSSRLLDILAFSAMATIFGIAWWTSRSRRPSARAWGIAASLTYLLIFLHAAISPHRVGGYHLGALLIGILGTVAFISRQEAT